MYLSPCRSQITVSKQIILSFIMRSGPGLCFVQVRISVSPVRNASINSEGVMDFLYSDIYEEGLVERVQASNDAAGDYYNEMDAIKKEEG